MSKSRSQKSEDRSQRLPLPLQTYLGLLNTERCRPAQPTPLSSICLLTSGIGSGGARLLKMLVGSGGANVVSIVGSGGANRDRTGDLLLAKQALSQLSYGPARQFRASVDWWAREDLNFRPHAYQARALTS